MVKELEGKIEELEGLISCKITGEKEVDEVHIVANKNRNPKRIVRDIETMVMVNLNQELDHKKISIAQIDDKQKARQENRIEIISIHEENNRPACHIKLNINNNVIEEEVIIEKGFSFANAIAEGMLDIIEGYTNFKGDLGIENVFTTGMKDELITVQILFRENNNFSRVQRLVGSAYIDNNLPLAVGKACLKALNRRLAAYI